VEGAKGSRKEEKREENLPECPLKVTVGCFEDLVPPFPPIPPSFSFSSPSPFENHEDRSQILIFFSSVPEIKTFGEAYSRHVVPFSGKV
jgi:hypothetical protein